MLLVIVIVFVTFICFGVLFIRAYLLNEPTHCKICRTRLRRHGFDQLLECPRWQKKGHTGREEWYLN